MVDMADVIPVDEGAKGLAVEDVDAFIGATVDAGVVGRKAVGGYDPEGAIMSPELRDKLTAYLAAGTYDENRIILHGQSLF